MYCGNCGKSLPDGMRFCPHCGTAIRTAGLPAAPPPPVEMPAVQRQSSGKGLRITFFLLLALMVGLLTVLLLSPGGSDRAVVHAILEQEPAVDLRDFAEWDREVFSLDTIGRTP